MPRRNALRKFAALLITVLCGTAITSCSGGGSGSGSGSPAPTVALVFTPASVAVGNAVTLTWTVANASTCTASGAWSGSEPATNTSIRVIPSGAGIYDYSLSCSGTGGSASASANLTVTLPQQLQTQVQAAQETANNSDPASSCGAISQNTSGSDNGFYWEIGDQNGVIADPVSGLSASGSVQPAATPGTNYVRDTNLLIASASKWLYGAYVAETKAVQQGGQWQMPTAYVPFLNFTSGYNNMADDCQATVTPTIQDCLNYDNGSGAANGSRTPADVGRFYYNSGHLEVFEGGADPSIANVMNGANDNISTLADAIMTALNAKGVNVSLQFATPVPAGGIVTTAANYAAFLQGMLRTSNPLVMSDFLNPTANDPYAVCTNVMATSCRDSNGQPLSVYTPVPVSVQWHYSITHWIEDDPLIGDGAYSSPGKFGFYPWVDSSKTYYGIIARYDSNPTTIAENAPYYKSIVCGAAIRKAFLTGTKQN